MSTHKHIDRVCCVVTVLALVLTLLFLNAQSLGVNSVSRKKGYETKLFDTAAVHSIDIIMDDWASFLDTCTNEEYALCSLVIDNEAYKNVAIRAKGNTSLTQVASYGNDRYSFKIEFDHYDSTKTYYGLDKLSLNNIIQDNTYVKDYLCYQLMRGFHVPAPLCSYVYIRVNGEDWGLYLAVEGVEEAFLERNYGSSYGKLYKPDSMDAGGGRGNGGRFNMDDWEPGAEDAADQDFRKQPMENMPAGGMNGFGFTGNSDVSLVYTDDAYFSYQNIFDNAKTEVSDADKDRLIASLQTLNAQENIEKVVNIEDVIRYFVVHNFVCNFDSYTGSMIHNYYLYEKDGQLSMIPWDYNLAFGGFVGGQDASALVNYPIDTPVSGGSVDARPMLSWIFSQEKYTELYHQYFEEFITEYFTDGIFTEMLDGVQMQISAYVEKDPTKFCSYDEFLTGIETLKSFCTLRAESIKGQLSGAIASTSEGQQEDTENFVDASAIRISDMGSMGGMGGMNPPESGGSVPPGNGDTPQRPDETDRPNGDQEGAPPSFPGGTPPDGEAPEKPKENFPSASNGEFPLSPAENSSASSEESNAAPTAPDNGEAKQEEPNFPNFPPDGQMDGRPSDMPQKGQSDSEVPNNTSESFLLLILSAAVLLAGILIAFLYKKR